MADNRAIGRLHKHYPVLIQDGDRAERGMSCDVSEKGISIFTHRKLTPGEKLTLILLPDDAVLLKFNYTGEVQWCSENDRCEFAEFEYVAGVVYHKAWGEPIDEVESPQDHYDLSRTITVNAPARVCYDVICDFENYPEWHTGVVKVLVRERSEDEKPLVVQWFAHMIVRQLSYTNVYVYNDKDLKIKWKMIHGDLARNEGRYTFVEKSPGNTLVTFEFTVELGFRVPKRVIDFLSNIAYRKVMQEIKQRAEQIVRHNAEIEQMGR